MLSARNSYLHPTDVRPDRSLRYGSLVTLLTSDDPARTNRYFGYPFFSSLLVVLVVLYSFTASVNLAVLMDPHGVYKLQQVYPNLPYWVLPCATIIAALNVTWVVSMMLGKRLGFYAFVATNLGMAIVQVVAAGFPHSTLLTCLQQCSITILLPPLVFWLLRSGGPRSLWTQFE